MNKSKVVVSRQWKNPEITAFVDAQEVGASMSVAQFIESIVEQSGNPAMVMTKSQLTARLQAAAEAVIVEMKRSTAKVM